MKFEIIDKDISKSLAEIAEQHIYEYLNQEQYSMMWYNKEIATALYEGVKEIVEGNKDKIIAAIIDKAADKLCRNVTLSAIIAALGKNESKF